MMKVISQLKFRLIWKGNITLCLFLLPHLVVFGQQNGDKNLTQFQSLQYTSELPKDFLSTKTAVFVSVPPAKENAKERGDWKPFSEKVHKDFRKMGIDAVAYYYLDDLVCGKDPVLAFTKEMAKRKITNLVLLTESNVNGKQDNTARFSVVITEFNGKASIMSNGQHAYRRANDDLKELMVNLGKDVYRAKQAKTNFMIMDVPEFFTSTDIIDGRRFPIYAKDLKVDKLAVPLFQLIPLPDEELQMAGSEEIRQHITARNEEITADNERLKKIMETYPLKYVITDKFTDDDLYNAGYDYVLLKLNTTGVTIRELLGYQIDRSETDYITVKSKNDFTTLERISVQTPVHKYYVKHLYTKDIYVGGKWDADVTWNEALQNFVHNMLDALKVKKKN